MARADSYGDIARLEQLLDEYAAISAMDPAKLPAIRAQIWTLIQAARLDHDLGLSDRPDDDGFDDFLLHVDGWLCEVRTRRSATACTSSAAPHRPRAGQPGAGDPARPADLGRHHRAPRAA
ncbi:cobaltochelatase subunit CobN [Streptomyces sp. M19]